MAANSKIDEKFYLLNFHFFMHWAYFQCFEKM